MYTMRFFDCFSGEYVTREIPEKLRPSIANVKRKHGAVLHTAPDGKMSYAPGFKTEYAADEEREFKTRVQSFRAELEKRIMHAKAYGGHPHNPYLARSIFNPETATELRLKGKWE